jgi:hypothetical protein
MNIIQTAQTMQRLAPDLKGVFTLAGLKTLLGAACACGCPGLVVIPDAFAQDATASRDRLPGAAPVRGD